MRIRSIKPEFWRSDDVAALSLEDRLLFIGLWSYVDDSGIGVDKLPHICADLFAPDLAENPPDTLARVAGGLLKLSERGMIQRYRSENKPYLYVTNWSSHQRIDKPGKQRFPGPEQADPEERPPIRENVARVTETVAPGTEEQGNRGTGDQGAEEQSSSSDADASDPADDPAFTDDVYQLCNTLADAVRANGHKVPTIGKTWWQACERLIRIDGYTYEQIDWMIRWSTSDEFWAANIQSMPTLRKKFSQMKLQATRGKKSQRESPDDMVARTLALGMSEQEGIEA